MASLSHYYSSAKGGLSRINPVEATELGEDMLIAGGTGAVLGLIAAAKGGSLDMTIAGMQVPIDGLMSFGLGLAGLSLKSKELKVAAIAAGGSASARAFTGFFKKGLAAHGEFDAANEAFGNEGMQYGWGADAGHDRLVEAAKFL
jgi:hypothetical protein